MAGRETLENDRSLAMTTAFHYAALPRIVALAMVPASALAANNHPLDPPYDIALDIDHDGKMDRAVLVVDPANGHADLYIYLAAGSGNLVFPRKPTILKKNLTAAQILRFESNGKGTLIVMSGCGGCSNDYATTLRIVYRGGKFLVGGVTYDWDTRSGIGSCDINFLTGNGVTSRELGKSRPINAKFAPVKLGDWSEEKRPKACK
jgi:hypothetical protein